FCSEKQSQHRQEDQEDPHLNDVSHISFHDAHVNDLCHQKRDQDFYKDFQCHQNRGQECFSFVFPHRLQQFPIHLFTFLSITFILSFAFPRQKDLPISALRHAETHPYPPRGSPGGAAL